MQIHVILILTILFISIYGQNEVFALEPSSFILTTDKSTYYEEEEILISGEVPIYEEGYGMTFLVITSSENI